MEKKIIQHMSVLRHVDDTTSELPSADSATRYAGQILPSRVFGGGISMGTADRD